MKTETGNFIMGRRGDKDPSKGVNFKFEAIQVCKHEHTCTTVVLLLPPTPTHFTQFNEGFTKEIKPRCLNFMK